MRGRVAHVVAAVVGGAASLVLIAYAFFHVDLSHGLHLRPRFPVGAWLRSLPQHLDWALPFAALTAALPALRGLLWGRTLPAPPPPLPARAHALALGGLVHNVIPGRLGLFASAWVLSRRARLPFASATASLLVAKLIELGALVLITAAFVAGTALAGGTAGRLAQIVGVGLAALLVLAAATIVATKLAPRLGRSASRRGRFPRLAAALGEFGAGLAAIGSSRRLLAACVSGLGPVLCAALAYGLALRAVGAPAGLLGGPMVLGALTFGQLTPGLPIATGVYYFVATWAARELGAGDAAAATFALVTHVATVTTNILVGAGAALASRDSWRELLAIRRRGAEPVGSTP